MNYTTELFKSINEDGVNVKGYFAWSLMDNFEWSRGYTERFGLFYTSFNRPDKLRTMKASGYFYKNLAATNGFPSKEELVQWQRDAYSHW